MCPYAAAHSQLAFFMNNTPVLAVITVINDDFNNWQQQLGRIHLKHKPAAKWKHATSQRNKSTEVLTEEEATATTPRMLERVQAERVGGNVSEKKRVFLESLLCLSHRLVRYTFSSVWSEMFEWRNQTSFSQVLQVKPWILCVCVHYLFLSPFLFRSSFGSFPIWRNNDSKHADHLFKITTVFFHGSVTL